MHLVTAHESHVNRALIRYHEMQPDVVLLDIGLPRLNGLEVARRIRAQRPGDTVLLIALTGWGQDEDRQRSTQAGFDLHMVKPLDIDALLAWVAARD
jgi:DNA-binding response OmpR family regulator